MLKMCGWTDDYYTAICAECLILVTENISIQINKIWEVMRFRETAFFFFPFVFWFFYNKHIFCWRGAEYGPLVNHFGTWVILKKFLEGNQDPADPGKPFTSPLTALNNWDWGLHQTEPLPDITFFICVAGRTSARLISLWTALLTSEASGPIPSLSSGHYRGLSSLTANESCFYGVPVATKLVYHLLTSYVSQL